MIKIVIPGEPEGKGRPKFGNGKARTPEKTRAYENYIQYMFLDTKEKPLHGYIKMDIIAYYGIPKSKSKKIQEQMRNHELRPSKKPDIDNVFKVVADALNELAYHDDSQIVDGSIKKYYSDDPRVEVYIEEI